MYDLVIIGAGSAGLSAAIYAARAGLDFVVYEQDGYGGGQITTAHRVENFPGTSAISGADLAEAFRTQALELGAKIEFGIVCSVTDMGEYKQITFDDGTCVQSRAVIAATGSVPRPLGVPGERELIGKGVSYCAVCDGAFFKGKDVIVVGGGDTAIEDAIYLSAICNSVTLIHRRDELRGAKSRAKVLDGLKNVTLLYNSQLTEIIGKDRVSAVDVNVSGGQRQIKADGVFIAVGVTAQIDYLNGLGVKIKDGYVVAGEDCKTDAEGVFAAGDIRTKGLRQVITAAADGAYAVNSVMEYLEK